MTFDQWLNRPVYKAQVKTFNIARGLLGLPDGDLATSGNHPVSEFRVLPKYRTAQGLALRKRVADIARQLRKAKKGCP
jgi:hypothetical protein